jgi:hypothetical protein
MKLSRMRAKESQRPAFVAFYTPPREPSTIPTTLINVNGLITLWGLLSLEIFYVLSELTKSWLVEVT